MALSQHSQLAELGAGQAVLRVIGTVAAAGDDAQAGEHLHRLLHAGLVRGQGRRNAGADDPQAKPRRQQQGENTLFHL